MRNLYAATVILLLLASSGFAKVGGGDVVFPGKQAGKAVFSHDFHVGEAGLSCTECHDRLYVTHKKDKRVTMAEMNKGKSCGACHNGKKAFSVKGECNRCHKK